MSIMNCIQIMEHDLCALSPICMPFDNTHKREVRFKPTKNKTIETNIKHYDAMK